MTYRKRYIFFISIALLSFLLLWFFENASAFIRILTALIGIICFYLFDEYFKMDFQLKQYIYLFIIVFFGILLSPLYLLSRNYDKILHLVMPILVSGIIFTIVNKQPISLKWKLLTTLSLTISFLALFEIFEYLADVLLNFKLQGVYVRDIASMGKLNLIVDKIDDTMMDLILGVVGSLIFTFWKLIKTLQNKKNQVSESLKKKKT